MDLRGRRRGWAAAPRGGPHAGLAGISVSAESRADSVYQRPSGPDKVQIGR